MNKLRGVWYALVYFMAWTKFSFHYVLVWEIPGPGGFLMSDGELEELKVRMANGPMRFEFERIQRLRQRAIESIRK